MSISFKRARARSASKSQFLQFARLFQLAAPILITGVAMLPTNALACACGCGVFDVGVNTLPSGATGLTVYVRYSYMNQNQNWEGSSKALASDNSDKEIQTDFYTVGADYMVSDNWMVMAELPIYQRALTTTDDGTVFGPAGSIYTGNLTAMGDLEISGVYTGLSSDMSTGLSFGIKMPTGDYTGPNGPLGGAEFDRDSLPGTGSTDVMLGGYHAGSLTADDALTYFVQGLYRIAFLTRDQYRPGNELDAVAGLSYDFGAMGPLSKLAPTFQLINSYRQRDSGANADPLNSGYERVLLAPGIETQFNNLRVYANVAFPVYQYTNAASSVAIEGTSGQLTAKTLLTIETAYDF
jgi:hypothetical protein